MNIVQVITTDASDRYHATPDCPQFQAGRKGSEAQGNTPHPIRYLTPEEAKTERKTPCPGCNPDS